MAERCPTPKEGCQYAGTPECLITRHHLYWPAAEYKGELEGAYRDLPENSVYLSRCDHDEVHLKEPPEKPSIISMAKAVVEARGNYTSARKQKLVRKLLEAI